MWSNVGKFLGRFTGFRPSKSLIKEQSAKIINILLDVEIKPEEIEEREGFLFLKSQNPALKNEIFLKKKLILSALKERLGEKSPRDIRF